MRRFNNWLVEFLDTKKVDPSDKCTAGDGTELELGDVITQIVKASPKEQAEIQRQFLALHRKGGKPEELLRTYASAMDKTHKRGE